MAFNPMAFIENLQYMGIGMLAIIIVMGVIIGITAGLNYTTSKLADKKQDKEDK